MRPAGAEFSARRPEHSSSTPSPVSGAVIRTAQPARAALDATRAALLIVRLILGITLLLLGVGSLSCQIEGSAGGTPGVAPKQWVRTIDGWERADLWGAPEPYVPQLHPLVVAAGQGLVSVLGLIACAGDGPARWQGQP